MLKNGWRILFFCLLILAPIITIASITLREPTIQQPPETTTTTVATTSLGIKTITAYNAVTYQTDNSPCISASGFNICETDKLICACPREYEFGTKFLIDGRVWECEDRLHEKYDGRIDLLMNTEEEAKKFGKQYLEVYIVE